MSVLDLPVGWSWHFVAASWGIDQPEGDEGWRLRTRLLGHAQGVGGRGCRVLAFFSFRVPCPFNLGDAGSESTWESEMGCLWDGLPSPKQSWKLTGKTTFLLGSLPDLRKKERRGHRPCFFTTLQTHRNWRTEEGPR